MFIIIVIIMFVYLAGLPRTTIEPLQRVQNAAARLVLNLGFRDHVTPALQQLHWLPVEYRIKYKLCALMHQIHTGCAPQYLVDSVHSQSLNPAVDPVNTANYVKRCIHTKIGERCFSHAGPAAWNSLPASIKLTTDTNIFKKLLKSHLFHIAFWHFLSAPRKFVSLALQIPICILFVWTEQMIVLLLMMRLLLRWCWLVMFSTVTIQLQRMKEAQCSCLSLFYFSCLRSCNKTPTKQVGGFMLMCCWWSACHNVIADFVVIIFLKTILMTVKHCAVLLHQHLLITKEQSERFMI